MGLEIKPRGQRLHIVGTYLGVRVRRSTGLRVGEIAEATRIRGGIEREIVSGTYSQVKLGNTTSFRELADSYLAWKAAEGRRDRELIGRADRFCERWGDEQINDITTDDVLAWAARDMAHLAPGSILRYLGSFKAMMNYGHERGWLDRKLVVPLPVVDDARDEHFDEVEANAFLAWMKAHEPEHELAFTLLIDSGLRLGEAIRLTWRDVRFADDVLVVRKKIHGKARTRKVPISNDLGVVLDGVAQRGVKPGDKVVVAKGGKPWSGANAASAGLRGPLRRGCEALGIEPLRVHDLRHTFAYLAAKGGADLGDLQQMMGHERIEMTLRYRGFMPNRSRAVIKNIRRECVKIVSRLTADL